MGFSSAVFRRKLPITLVAFFSGVSLVGAVSACSSTRAAVIPAGYVRSAQLVTAHFGWRLTTRDLQVTHDSGSHWQTVLPAGLSPHRIQGAWFLDSRHGWIVETKRMGDVVDFRTVDGGKTWRLYQIAPPSAESADSQGGGVSVDFVTKKVGWVDFQLASSSAFSRGALYGTADGGKNWTSLAGPVFGSLAFVSPRVGWMVGGVEGTQVLLTKNGGGHWIPRPPAGLRHLPANAVTFSVSEAAGTAVLRANLLRHNQVIIYRSRGSSGWRRMASFDDRSINLALLPIAVSSSGVVLAALGNGSILALSSTGKEIWKGSLRHGGYPSQISASGSRGGWAVVQSSKCWAFKQCSEYSTLYATRNSGRAWRELR